MVIFRPLDVPHISGYTQNRYDSNGILHIGWSVNPLEVLCSAV